MNKEQKQEVIEALKDKFTQYSNFYITNTESLSVAQVTNLRRHCFNKQVEMKVAKNTLIKKALESLDNDKYSGVYDSLHQVTALMFSESPKEPALIISSFRKELNAERPVLKAAFLNGDIFVGDNQLVNLTKIKTKNELIGEVIGLLMSPIQRVIGALQNRKDITGNSETQKAEPEASTQAKSSEKAASKADSTETLKTESTSSPKIEATSASKAESSEGPMAETKIATNAEGLEASKPESTEAQKADNNKPSEDLSESKPESEAK